jgi:hypothetical protein
MDRIIVRPGDDEIKNGLVACWDQDPEHIAADPAWEQFGGAYVVGDPKHPDKTFTVAGTAFVYACIQKGRLVKVSDAPTEVPPAVKPETVVVTTPDTPATEVPPAETSDSVDNPPDGGKKKR